MKKLICLMSVLVLIFTFTACAQSTSETSDSEVAVTVEPTETVAESTEEAVEEPEVSEDKSEESPSDKILIYISGSEAMINKLESTFEEENGDVCDFVIMSCGQLRSKTWTEKEAGNIQADVIWGSDPLIYNKLDDAELLEPVAIKDIDNINEQYILSDRAYYLVNERYITIIYNKDQLSEEPPSGFNDLTNEKYNGMVVKADASQSSTAFAITSSLYQLFGNNVDYFNALKDNNIMLSKSNGLVPSMIMEGQAVIGIGPHDSVFRLKNKGKKEGFDVPLEIAWPSEGVISIQRPIALTKNESRSAEKDEISKKLINFLLSKKAQTITTNFGFVSVRKDIENTFLPDGINVYSVDWEQATANENTVKTEYQNIFH